MTEAEKFAGTKCRESSAGTKCRERSAGTKCRERRAGTKCREICTVKGTICMAESDLRNYPFMLHYMVDNERVCINGKYRKR